MPANWADTSPDTSTLYTDVLTALRDRDKDAVTHFYAGDGTNLQTGSLKYLRASDKWQEWNGAAWVDKLLAIAGGGTGANSAAGARTNLGIGTLGTQAANAVAITGGTITGITSLQIASGGSVTFAADNNTDIGTNAARPRNIFTRSGLVIPVGVDKYVTV